MICECVAVGLVPLVGLSAKLVFFLMSVSGSIFLLYCNWGSAFCMARDADGFAGYPCFASAAGSCSIGFFGSCSNSSFIAQSVFDLHSRISVVLWSDAVLIAFCTTVTEKITLDILSSAA